MSRDVGGDKGNNQIVSPPPYKTPSTLQTTHTQIFDFHTGHSQA